MKVLQFISALLLLLISLPIWYYLLYKILLAINATELMWFLYYIYLPVGVINTIISKIIEKSKE